MSRYNKYDPALAKLRRAKDDRERKARLQRDTEQEQNDKLEELAGGTSRAFRLMRLWETCTQSASGNKVTTRKLPTSEERFRRRAKEEGYSPECIELYLTM